MTIIQFTARVVVGKDGRRGFHPKPPSEACTYDETRAAYGRVIGWGRRTLWLDSLPKGVKAKPAAAPGFYEVEVIV